MRNMKTITMPSRDHSSRTPAAPVVDARTSGGRLQPMADPYKKNHLVPAHSNGEPPRNHTN